MVLVFAGATSHAISLPSIPPASHSHPHLLGDGLTTYRYDSQGRLESASTAEGEDAPTTKYAHNALGQRVFKTEPLFSGTAQSSTSTKSKTGKNLNNLLADDDDGGDGEEESEKAESPGLIQQFLNFWSRLWSPGTSDAEKLGFSYVYAEDGSLLGEYGSGGSNSTGTAQYIYLPTASGPMPIAAIIKGQAYAIHSDHLNTPRKLTQADGQAAWQWAYSAFGDEQPTTAAKRFTSRATTPTTGSTSIPEVQFNLRYPGQYFDQETKLHYNHFRSYSPTMGGRYTQGDPIGLDGGWNGYLYAEANPLSLFDPDGLQVRQAPPSITHSGGIAAPRVQTLLSQIRQYNPSYSYQALRPSTGPGGGYNNADVASLMGILRGYQNAQACTRAGVPIGRFITDSNGNVMLEPVGGSTGPYPPHRPNSPDTHTYYPNGSNYMRNNPQGHGSNTTPHGHGHLPGTGPGRSGQGSSTDIFGNPVPSNSGAAHWPTY